MCLHDKNNLITVMNRCIFCLHTLVRATAQNTFQVNIFRRLSVQSLLWSNNNSNHIRLIDLQGKTLGLMSKTEAESIAKNEKLTLKQVAAKSATITNSVYKLIELKTPSKSESGKQSGKPGKKSGNLEKELTMKSQIQDNDLNVKAKKLQQFLDRGSQVTIKITKPRRVTQLPMETYERLIAKLDCEVTLKGTPKSSESFLRAIIEKRNK